MSLVYGNCGFTVLTEIILELNKRGVLCTKGRDVLLDATRIVNYVGISMEKESPHGVGAKGPICSHNHTDQNVNYASSAAVMFSVSAYSGSTTNKRAIYLMGRVAQAILIRLGACGRKLNHNTR